MLAFGLDSRALGGGDGYPPCLIAVCTLLRGRQAVSAGAPATGRLLVQGFEIAHRFDGFVAMFDVRGRQGAHPLQRECLDVVAGEHGAVDDCFAQCFECDFSMIQACQVARQPARKGVARAGGVVDVLQRIRAAGEKGIFAK